MAAPEVLVFGKGGQLSEELGRARAGEAITLRFLGPPEFDLLRDDPGEAILAGRPSAVVNAAAYTAVDKAETEPEIAHRINASAVGEMARAAARLGVPFVHVSTDYVFAGDKTEPYVETDPTGPLGVYGRTKLEGETAAAAAGGDWTIFRTAWVFSPFGANFVKTMIRLAAEREAVSVVDDQIGRPTYAADIAALCLRATQDRSLKGTFHLAGADDATWADLAEEVFRGLRERGRRAPRLIRIPTSQYPTPAQRPANSRLSTAKLEAAAGWRPRPWKDAVRMCLAELT